MSTFLPSIFFVPSPVLSSTPPVQVSDSLQVVKSSGRGSLSEVVATLPGLPFRTLPVFFCLTGLSSSVSFAASSSCSLLSVRMSQSYVPGPFFLSLSSVSHGFRVCYGTATFIPTAWTFSGSQSSVSLTRLPECLTDTYTLICPEPNPLFSSPVCCSFTCQLVGLLSNWCSCK